MSTKDRYSNERDEIAAAFDRKAIENNYCCESCNRLITYEDYEETQNYTSCAEHVYRLLKDD